MDTVTFKLQQEILQKVDALLQPLNYNNRTEFIREAVREKINRIEEDVVLRALQEFKGSARKSVSNKQLHATREEVARKYAKKFGVSIK
ncbi:MAG: ribbon-helix-helix domain-containing protein [Candidatus Woesearchaeota archaeon]|nr:ribbon-helix-helix domain-containing protein [Candidatus Woesearchaeota archaeon]